MQNLSLIAIHPDPLPSFEEAMLELAPLIQLLYESLDAGATVCRQFYQEHCDGDTPAPHLREMIVRDQAKRYLTKNGLRVRVLKERTEFRLAAEPLISLLIHHRGFAVRVLKGRDGIPPGCGTSKRRREFYNQSPTRYLDSEGKLSASHTNILALWDFDAKFGVTGVWLACPELAGSRPQDVVLGWKELVPSPVSQAAAPHKTSVDTVRAEEQADEELEMLLLGREETGSSRDVVDLLAETVSEDKTTSPAEAEKMEVGADDRQSDKVGA
jgi:hypothetical protein